LAERLEVIGTKHSELAKRIGLFLGPILFAILIYTKPLALPLGGNEVVAAFAWMFRDLIVWLLPGLPLTDEIIALVAAISLFVIPVDWGENRALLTWEATRRLPWGIESSFIFPSR